MMKSIFVQFVLMLALGAPLAYGQGSLGPGPKRARTPDDYKPRTLREIAYSDAKSHRDAADDVIVHNNTLPSRVAVTYKGSARPLPQSKKNALHRWAQLYAGAPEHYTGPYEKELLFSERGVEYWLALRKQSIAQFKREFKKGKVVDLFLIRLGEAKVRNKPELLLLVENFQAPK